MSSDWNNSFPQQESFDILIEYKCFHSTILLLIFDEHLTNKIVLNQTCYLDKQSTIIQKSFTLSFNNQNLALNTVIRCHLSLIDRVNKIVHATDLAYGTVLTKYQGYNLYAANGDLFLIRGVNSQHADYDGYDRNYLYDALPSMRDKKFNSVRILWRKDLSHSGFKNHSYLERIIKRCIELKMIPIVELHDVTMSSTINDLLSMTEFWIEHIKLLIHYRKYIIVNICNEWGSFFTRSTKWSYAYQLIIQQIRQAGYSGVLLIDSPRSGQSARAIRRKGTDIIQSDPEHNILFSVHVYVQWCTWPLFTYNIRSHLLSYRRLNLPLIIGEFAASHPMPKFLQCTLVQIDIKILMKECYDLRIGYIGWSWKGNGNDECGHVMSYLDMSKDWNGTQLTQWGNSLIYNEYGINQTSSTCTIFKNYF
ncbi:unnamed protein product [Didymodactylos carnosus]|uniref:Glycoside hydrolase family 5 domain-containing protein n=1 Tax=Didymodactylos carnosus TaxID=1234261 RepID=A0A813ZJM1_9BILA|nr:unnamed protein product [Didymodactylos carnosus]CAF3683047.1 unnamed protein product [Didymodactylos carnosus]